MRALIKWSETATKEDKAGIRNETRPRGYLLGLNNTEEAGIVLSHAEDRYDELTDLVGDLGLVYSIEAPEPAPFVETETPGDNEI
jgi:hypothetical protein